jgi:succinate-semialdehyde dehydrogenase / glutarate-semialdehyde dehydrogenase
MQNIATLNDPSLFTEPCLVGGKWIIAEGGSAIEVTNPATEEVLGGVPNCGRKETDEAIAAAVRAFGPWSRRTGADRAAHLERWHDMVLHSVDDLALLMTLEQGKPLGESRAEVS